MAFQKTKPILDYSLVSAADPAIDTDKSDIENYELDYNYEISHLDFHEGKHPTLFHCKPLTKRLVTRLLDRMMHGNKSGDVELAIHEAAYLAFRYGVYDIENFSDFDKHKHIQNGNPSAIKESWLDKTDLPVNVVVEIGSVILAKSRISETERKN